MIKSIKIEMLVLLISFDTYREYFCFYGKYIFFLPLILQNKQSSNKLEAHDSQNLVCTKQYGKQLWNIMRYFFTVLNYIHNIVYKIIVVKRTTDFLVKQIIIFSKRHKVLYSSIMKYYCDLIDRGYKVLGKMIFFKVDSVVYSFRNMVYLIPLLYANR